jgi:hypothetical protein
MLPDVRTPRRCEQRVVAKRGQTLGTRARASTEQETVMQDPIEDIAHDIVRLMFKLWRNLGTRPPK